VLGDGAFFDYSGVNPFPSSANQRSHLFIIKRKMAVDVAFPLVVEGSWVLLEFDFPLEELGSDAGLLVLVFLHQLLHFCLQLSVLI